MRMHKNNTYTHSTCREKPGPWFTLVPHVGRSFGPWFTLVHTVCTVPFFTLLHMHSPSKHQLCRTRHVDVVVTLPPLNHQGPTGQVHPAASVHLPFQHTSHNSGTCTSAAGQGAPSSSLPHHHAHVAAGQHLYKLCVGLGGEDGVLLKLGADGEDVQLINLDGLAIHTVGDCMGVAHADAGHFVCLALNCQVLLNHCFPLGRGQRGWNRGAVQNRFTHIHAHLTVGKKLRLNQTGKCMNLVLARCCLVYISNEAG
mmetsp:Transcript_35769/g.79598  ORF Transcript_35769/g.79598 Transcript_35769/m.79598 type:complete len:255 (+) Transcript_35769:279-1043(+)